MSAPTTTSDSAGIPDEEPAGKVRWTTTVSGWIGAVRRRTTDWLDRPMTSFHLLLAVFFLLLGFGLLMVLSSSSVTAYRKEGSSFGTFKRQLLFAGVGMGAFYLAMRVRLSWLKAMSTSAMIGCLGLLVIVLGMPAINGAHSWILLGPISFQPSEFAKFALVIWGANVLASRRANLGSMKELLIPVLPVAILMAGLIVIEPDLGTTAALMVIVFALFFFSGASMKMFALLIGSGVTALVALAIVEPYRLKRIVSFLHPEADPQGSGLQLLQGLYGMADGGWFGVGLGESKAKWAYLPHAESDFIFAIVGEELGFIGAALLIGLYVTLALVGLRIARRNIDPFIKLVAATGTAWLVGQAAINIFYVIGLLPVTGLTLPMISAGGTSLLVTMMIFGLLANFARREPQAMAALQNSGPGPISKFFGIGIPGAGLEVSKKAQQRDQRKQNREWARTTARKAADEKRATRAAAKQRPVDRRDQTEPANRRGRTHRGQPAPVPKRVVSGQPSNRRLQPPQNGAQTNTESGRPRSAAAGTGRSAAPGRPVRPVPAGSSRYDAARNSARPDAGETPAQSKSSSGLAGWLGFGVKHARDVNDSTDVRDVRAGKQQPKQPRRGKS